MLLWREKEGQPSVALSYEQTVDVRQRSCLCLTRRLHRKPTYSLFIEKLCVSTAQITGVMSGNFSLSVSAEPTVDRRPSSEGSTEFTEHRSRVVFPFGKSLKAPEKHSHHAVFVPEGCPSLNLNLDTLEVVPLRIIGVFLL